MTYSWRTRDVLATFRINEKTINSSIILIIINFIVQYVINSHYHFCFPKIYPSWDKFTYTYGVWRDVLNFKVHSQQKSSLPQKNRGNLPLPKLENQVHCTIVDRRIAPTKQKWLRARTLILPVLASAEQKNTLADTEKIRCRKSPFLYRFFSVSKWYTFAKPHGTLHGKMKTSP